jgi:predicted PurR-regulated permease PerM
VASAGGKRAVWIGLCVLAVGLAGALVYPFAGSLFLACVLAAALSGWCDRLERVLRGRRALAAALLTAGVLVVLVVPLAWLGATAIGEVSDGVHYVRQTLESQGAAGLVARLPAPLARLGEQAAGWFGHSEQELQSLLGAQGGRAAAALGVVVAWIGNAVGKTALMLVAQFALLTDGRRLVAWLDAAIPLERGQLGELLADFRRVVVAVLLSTGATAAAQALAALGGFLIARVPQPGFFALVTFFLAFLPGGPAGVSLVLALFVWLGGHPLAGAFLAAWGLLVVSMVDNIVKPLLMKHGVRLHGVVIFFALLGGLSIFGPVGLLAGPLIVAFLLAVVRMQRRDTAVEGAIRRAAE